MLFIFLFIFNCFPPHLSQIYIHPNSSCTSCNGSLTSPFPDLKTALNNSNSSQFILMDGIFYIQNLSISNRNLNIKSMNGAQYSIIDGNYTSNCLNLIFGNYNIDEITIRNCIKYNDSFDNISQINSGAGVWVQSASVNLSNLIIKDSKSDFVGGGIGIISGSLFIYNCTIMNNSAVYGGGFYTKSASVLIANKSQIIDNSGKVSGGGMFIVSGSVEITNSSKVEGNQFSSNSTKNQVSCVSASVTFKNGSSYDYGYVCDRCKVVEITDGSNEVNLCIDSNGNNKFLIKFGLGMFVVLLFLTSI